MSEERGEYIVKRDLRVVEQVLPINLITEDDLLILLDVARQVLAALEREDEPWTHEIADLLSDALMPFSEECSCTELRTCSSCKWINSYPELPF